MTYEHAGNTECLGTCGDTANHEWNARGGGGGVRGADGHSRSVGGRAEIGGGVGEGDGSRRTGAVPVDAGHGVRGCAGVRGGRKIFANADVESFVQRCKARPAELRDNVRKRVARAGMV
jgi:hypothetical protein